MQFLKSIPAIVEVVLHVIEKESRIFCFADCILFLVFVIATETIFGGVAKSKLARVLKLNIIRSLHYHTTL